MFEGTSSSVPVEKKKKSTTHFAENQWTFHKLAPESITHFSCQSLVPVGKNNSQEMKRRLCEGLRVD